MGNLDQLFTMYMYLIYSTCSFVHLEYFMQVSRFHTHTDLTFFHPDSEIGRAGPQLSTWGCFKSYMELPLYNNKI